MSHTLNKSTERIQPDRFYSIDEYLVFLRHLAAYEFVLPLVSSNMNLIDYGSGEGYGTRLLSEKCAKVTGIDINEMSISHAQKKYQNEACNFEFFDGETIPAEDSSIDAVISFQVIEHVPDVKAYLEEIKRVLKKDGLFVCTTPNRLYRLRPGEKPWNPFHLREYAPDNLRAELQAVFGNTELRGVHGTEKAHKTEVARAQANWTLKSKIARNTPEFVKKTLKAFRGIISKPEPPSYIDEKQLSEFSSADFFVKDSDISNSLDLLGLSKKN